MMRINLIFTGFVEDDSESEQDIHNTLSTLFLTILNLDHNGIIIIKYHRINCNKFA